MIVDDHNIFCEGLKWVLETKDEFTVVAVAKNGFEAIQKAEEYLPDIILMDVEMPKMGGIEATRVIKKRLPFVNILMLTMHAQDKLLFESREAGACGYILKDADMDILCNSIIQADKECENKTKKIISVFPDLSEKNMQLLTPREQEIISLVAAGYTNKEIAHNLFVSTHTIKNHLSRIFAKINCTNRTEAVTYFLENNETRG
ncbi:MAG: response regulator transcription factor [Bacillota bacterium]